MRSPIKTVHCWRQDRQGCTVWGSSNSQLHLKRKEFWERPGLERCKGALVHFHDTLQDAGHSGEQRCALCLLGHSPPVRLIIPTPKWVCATLRAGKRLGGLWLLRRSEFFFRYLNKTQHFTKCAGSIILTFCNWKKSNMHRTSNSFTVSESVADAWKEHVNPSSNYPPSDWQITLLPPLTLLSLNSGFRLIFMNPPEHSLVWSYISSQPLCYNANAANPHFVAYQAETALALCHRNDSKTNSKPPYGLLFLLGEPFDMNTCYP